MDDHQLAAWLAEQTGQLLIAIRDGRLDGVQLGYVGDQTANAFILSTLAMLRPDDHIISEESPDDPARLGASRVWIIDPLDGTREYVEGRADWAVHIALTIDGAPVAGAVAQAACGRCYDTASVSAPSPLDRKPIMLVSRTRPPEGAAALAEALSAEVRGMGSAGAKAAAVIAGEADIYFHTGGQHEWDNCAPVAVALAAGLMACRIDGSPIRYNQAQLGVPDLIIARPDIGRGAIDFLNQT